MPTQDENKLLRKKQFDRVIEELCKKIKEKFVSDVTFVKQEDANDNQKQKNKLQVTKNGTPTILEPFVVTEWKDLKDVQEYTTTNELDFSKHKAGYWLGNSLGEGVQGNGTGNLGWGVVEFDVESNQQYTLLRKTTGHNNFKFITVNSDGGHIEFFDRSRVQSANGWYKYSFQTDGQTKKIIIEVKLDEDGRSGQEMLIKQADVDTANLSFIPYTDKYPRQAKNISIGFNPTGSNLKSTTVESAIKEVMNKCDIIGKDNVFTGTNEFNSSLRIGKVEGYAKVGGSSGDNPFNSGKLSGHRLKTAKYAGNDGYVSSIEIRVLNSKDEGESATVSVYAVTKGTGGVSDDIVSEVIADKKVFKVQQGKAYGKALIVPVNKRYDENTYFVIHSHTSSFIANTNASETGNLFNEGLKNDSFKKGESLGTNVGSNWSENNNWVVDYTLFNGYNVVDEIDRIKKELSSAGGGTVKSVNGVQPQQDANGNIVLTTTTAFEENKLKLKTIGGSQNEFATVDCYTQDEATTLLGQLT